MRTLEFTGGETLPVVGQGTWAMGRDRRSRREEADALRLGFDLGMTLVDTAEMYADGGAEEVVAEALRGRRETVFVVSKVLPQNASRRGTVAAAEHSLRRLNIDCIDLYLLHWPGAHPLQDTLAAFAELVEAGKIRYWGVSNFDRDGLILCRSMDGGASMMSNQVVYNLTRRGIEPAILPWCRERGIMVMAYSPLDQGQLPRTAVLNEVAAGHGVSPETVAIAWTVRESGVLTIPKASRPAHVRANAAAGSLVLTPDDLAALDGAHLPPDGDAPLEML